MRRDPGPERAAMIADAEARLRQSTGQDDDAGMELGFVVLGLKAFSDLLAGHGQLDQLRGDETAALVRILHAKAAQAAAMLELEQARAWRPPLRAA